MRKILSAVGLALLLTAQVAWANGGTVTLPADAYQAILHRLDSLQKRVDELEAKDRQAAEKPCAVGQAVAAPRVEKLEHDVQTIYDTLDNVETKTLMDRINLGAELRARVDNFKLRDHFDPSTGKTVDWSTDNHWTNRFRLNMDAEIMKNLQFHGRLAVYKNWADIHKPVMYADANAAHVPADTSVKLDRAYVDWVVPNSPVPLAITFGRQPSSEGPPLEFKENRPRQSTYPALLFDGEADGIVATVGLERYLGWKNSGLRFAYGKGYQSDNEMITYMDDRGGPDDLNVAAVFFESEIPSLPNSLMVLSYVRGWDFVDTPVAATGNLGDMDVYGIHAQASNIGNSGLDAFVSWGLNRSHPNGHTAMVSYLGQVGLLSNDGQDDHTGWAIYAGLRYTLPVAALNEAKIGFEYNHGSRYWFSFTQGSTELYNKLGTRGDAYDFYYIQPFNKYLFLRTGYTWVDYSYSGSGWHIGQPVPINDALSDFYVLIDCRF